MTPKKPKKLNGDFAHALLLCALCACSNNVPPTPLRGYITPKLTQYIHEFEGDFDVTVDIPVSLVPTLTVEPGLPSNAIGAYYCCGYPHVEILDKYDGSKLLDLLVYHELGHWLGMPHYDAVTPDIMNSAVSFQVQIEWPGDKQELVEALQARFFSGL